MPTVQRILELAPTSCRLAKDYKAKRSGLFGGTRAAITQPEWIYAVYKILNKIYTTDPTYEATAQQQVANYLFELCQKFAFKAANIVDGGGGGSIAPITPTVKPSRIEFEASPTTFIPEGETTVQLPVSWDGWNVEVERGNVPQSTLSTQPSYFSYDEDTRELILTPAVQSGELIAIIPSV